jgi:hypothetical protein
MTVSRVKWWIKLADFNISAVAVIIVVAVTVAALVGVEVVEV